MSCLQSPPRGTKLLWWWRSCAAPLWGPRRGDSACSPPLRPPRAGPSLLVGQPVPAEVPEPRLGETLQPHGVRLAARLGLASRPLHAAPGLIDELGAGDKVLGAPLVELGLDELPELWLGHHELHSPWDLPAGS